MVVDGAQVAGRRRTRRVDGAREGTLFVDMSTIAPADARRIGAALKERGHGFVDAPVTGSAPRAEDGTLTIMCGGADEDLERARPLFEAMGEKIVHAGETRPGPGGQGDLQLGQRDQLRRRSRRRWWSAARRASTSTRCSR